MEISYYGKSPIVIFELTAYQKMMGIVQSTYLANIEKAWLGCVDRPKPYLFIIKDIFIPPQKNNSATYVEIDEQRLSKWIIDQQLDPFTLRLHGHTHPNMPPTPSLTDNQMMEQLKNEGHEFFLRIIVSTTNHDYYLDLFDNNIQIHYKHLNFYVELEKELVYAKNKKLILNKYRSIPQPLNTYLEKLTQTISMEDDLKQWISRNTLTTSTPWQKTYPYTLWDAEPSDPISQPDWYDWVYNRSHYGISTTSNPTTSPTKSTHKTTSTEKRQKP